jgi:hypothetical protein
MTSASVRKIDPAELARRELARRGIGHRPLHWALAFPLSLLLLVVSGWLLYSFGMIEPAWWRDSGVLKYFAPAFALATLFFCICHCAPMYVFGHEMTHYLTAKLLRHRTGKVELGWRKGYVEVPEPNAIIVLAPYVIPFYFLLSVGLLALPDLVLPEGVLPSWYGIAVMCWLAVCAAFHVVLTCIAVFRAQSDLEYCGRFLSLCIILTGNIAVFRAITQLAYFASI